MTVESEVGRTDAVGNATTASYDFTFKVFADEDLLVVVTLTDGTETELTLGTHYTVTGAGDADGGTVVLVDGAYSWLDGSGHLDTDVAISLLRRMDLVQETDLTNQGRYFAEDVERMADQSRMIDQQQQEQIDRSLQMPIGEPGSAAARTLPSVADRASQFLGFDASGNPIAAAAITGGTAASAYIQTLLVAADAAAARGLIGGLPKVVATIAALRALTGTDLTGTVLVQGYAAIGDGGGGLFLWSSADSSTDNLGTIVIPDSAGVGRWHRLWDGALDVRWFGAKFDGTTDDATAINAAITAANAAGGGTVLMPYGTARLAAKITMKASVRLLGSGWSTILKPTDASADAVNPLVHFRNITKAEASDFAIDGNATGLTQAVGHAAIRMAGCSDCIVDRIRVSDCGKTALSPSGEQILITAYEALDTVQAQDIAGVESRRNRISNCLLEDASAKSQMAIRVFTNWLYDVAETAFTVLNADNVIENNHLIGFQFNGIEICGPAAKYNLVRGNTMVGHLGFSGIEADKGASYNRFLGNSVRATVGGAGDFTSLMRCQGGVSASFNRYARGNLFSGNILAGLGTSYTGSMGMFFSRAYNNQFIGNILDVTQDAGISHGVVVGDRVSGVVIAENQIRGITGNGAAITNEDYQANLAENMSDFEIRDNVVNSAYNGILFANTDAGVFTLSDIRVIGNRVSGGTSNKGINLSTGTSDALVADNRISALTGDALYTNGANVTFRDNHIVGQSAGAAVYLAAASTGAAVIGNITRARTSGDNAYRNDSADTPFLDQNWFEGTVIADSVGPKVFHDTAAPIAGTWRIGDTVWNSTPASGGPPGWVCTTGGTPGTWKAMANLA